MLNVTFEIKHAQMIGRKIRIYFTLVKYFLLIIISIETI